MAYLEEKTKKSSQILEHDPDNIVDNSLEFDIDTVISKLYDYANEFKILTECDVKDLEEEINDFFEKLEDYIVDQQHFEFVAYIGPLEHEVYDYLNDFENLIDKVSKNLTTQDMKNIVEEKIKNLADQINTTSKEEIENLASDIIGLITRDFKSLTKKLKVELAGENYKELEKIDIQNVIEEKFENSIENAFHIFVQKNFDALRSSVEKLNKVSEYYKEYSIFLPLVNDPRYKNIANYKDYEFTYCIAFEMAIRTDEFNTIKHLPSAIEDIQSLCSSYLDDLENDEKLNFIKNLNFQFQYFDKGILAILFTDIQSGDLEKELSKTLRKMLNNLLVQRDKLNQNMNDLGILDITFFLTQDMIVVDPDYEFMLLDQIRRTLTIDDFNNGLHLLVEYFLTKEKIYQKVNKDDFELKQLTTHNESISIDDILNDLEPYYLDINSKIIKLSKDIPITILDMDLKNTLKKHYKKYQYIDVQPNYTRPQLHFINSKIINLPLNLNFSQDELIALVTKIKKDYDSKNSIIQTPIELLGEKLEKAMEPKSLAKMPKGNKRKEAFAIAFCVYDLYKVLTPIYEHLDGEFKNKKIHGKKYDKDNVDNRKIYNKLELKNEIASIVGISTDKVEYFYALMTEYIKDKKYIELITGHKQNTNE